MLKFRWVVAGFIVAGLVGCITPTGASSNNANLGGGSLITAGAKVALGTMSSLTPRELELLIDAANQSNAYGVNIQMDDTQAIAAVEFLQANNLDTIAEIENAISQAESKPDSVVIPDGVAALISAGNLPEVTAN